MPIVLLGFFVSGALIGWGIREWQGRRAGMHWPVRCGDCQLERRPGGDPSSTSTESGSRESYSREPRLASASGSEETASIVALKTASVPIASMHDASGWTHV